MNVISIIQLIWYVDGPIYMEILHLSDTPVAWCRIVDISWYSNYHVEAQETFNPCFIYKSIKDMSKSLVSRACHPAAIAGATILVPCHVVKALQRVTALQMNCGDQIKEVVHQDSGPKNVHQSDMPHHYIIFAYCEKPLTE